MVGQYKRISVFCLLTLFLVTLLPTLVHAAKLGGEQDKKKIVELIEKNIPAVLNFTIESQVLLPDFTKLYGLINNWDKGDPAAARAGWLAHQYVHYNVEYDIESVEFFSAFSARAMGKKKVVTKNLCRWADNCLCTKDAYSRFLWSDLKKRKRQCIQKYSDKKFFIIMFQKSTDGNWELLSEQLLKKKPETGDTKKPANGKKKKPKKGKKGKDKNETQ